MAARSVRRMGLEEEVVARLCGASCFTASDVLNTTELQLVAQLDVNLPEAHKVQSRVAEAILRQPHTALALLEERQREPSFIATGLPTIDAAMQGGFPTGMITELVGVAGVGKTQLCLSLAAQCCLPRAQGGLGSAAGIVVLDTERKFSAQRLREVACNRAPMHYGPGLSDNGEEKLQRLLDNTTVMHVDRAQDLLSILEELQPLIIEGNKRLIILDSVAALARKDYAEQQSMARQDALMAQAALLKRLADAYQAVVLVTNQVTTRFGADVFQVDIDGGEGGGGALIPALGNTWHHCVSNRLVLRAPARVTSAAALDPASAYGAPAAVYPTAAPATASGGAAANGSGGSGAASRSAAGSDGAAGGGSIAMRAGAAAGSATGTSVGGGQRTIAISKSPLAPRVHCAFVVCAGGVVEE